jgi:hypothetical protein
METAYRIARLLKISSTLIVTRYYASIQTTAAKFSMVVVYMIHVGSRKKKKQSFDQSTSGMSRRGSHRSRRQHEVLTECWIYMTTVCKRVSIELR